MLQSDIIGNMRKLFLGGLKASATLVDQRVVKMVATRSVLLYQYLVNRNLAVTCHMIAKHLCLGTYYFASHKS